MENEKQDESTSSSEDEVVWSQIVSIYQSLDSSGRQAEFSAYLEKFFSPDFDRVLILRKALRGPDRFPAFYIAKRLVTDELIQLFPELIFLASWEHGAVQSVRNLILSLPRKWVIENIESYGEPLLLNGTYDEYRRFLELYIQLEYDLTRRLALRAVKSDDPDIREAGKDFLEKLQAT